jgi:hypothetical protein
VHDASKKSSIRCSEQYDKLFEITHMADVELAKPRRLHGKWQHGVARGHSNKRAEDGNDNDDPHKCSQWLGGVSRPKLLTQKLLQKLLGSCSGR